MKGGNFITHAIDFQAYKNETEAVANIINPINATKPAGTGRCRGKGGLVRFVAEGLHWFLQRKKCIELSVIFFRKYQTVMVASSLNKRKVWLSFRF